SGGVIAEDGPTDVTGNGDYVTPAGASPTQAGTYYWVATYSGDSNNKAIASGCADEPVVIGQAQPKVETTQDPASGTVGDTFKDNAKLSGLFGAHAGGTVSFKLFNNKSCDASEGGLIASDGPVSVDGNGEYATPHGASPTQAGTYYWGATYSGDANTTEAVSGCADAPVVTAAKPVLPPPPAVAVLPLHVISGLAAPHGPLACVARTTPVYVKGRQLQSATFFLDGRKVKTVTGPDKS